MYKPLYIPDQDCIDALYGKIPQHLCNENDYDNRAMYSHIQEVIHPSTPIIYRMIQCRIK